jgi:hypothetical protein
MSGFFEWLKDYAPLGVMLILWIVVFPLRLMMMLLLPLSAKSPHHWLNNVYEFFAFDGDGL